MKHLFLMLCLLLGVNKGLAQNYELGAYYDMLGKNVAIPVSSSTHIIDSKGILTPFLGYWVGNYKQYTYEFFVRKGIRIVPFDKRKIDCLYVDFNVYDNSIGADIYKPILTSTNDYAGGGITHLATLKGYHLTPRGTYSLFYRNKENDFACIAVQMQDSSRMSMYIMADPNSSWSPDDTPFPYWNGWKGVGDTTILHRRGGIDQRPPSLPPVRSGTFDLTTLNQLLRYTYIARWEQLGIKYVHPDLINRLELSQETFSESKRVRVIPREERGTIRYSLDFCKDFPRLRRGEKIGVYYRSLYHVALFDEVLKMLSQRSDKALYRQVFSSEEYRSNFKELLRLYARLKGMTVESVNKLIVEDLVISASSEVYGSEADEATSYLSRYLFNRREAL